MVTCPNITTYPTLWRHTNVEHFLHVSLISRLSTIEGNATGSTRAVKWLIKSATEATRMLRETHQHLDIFSYYGKFHLSLIETEQVCFPMHSFHSRLMGRNALRGNFSVKLPNFALEWHWLTFKYETFLKSLGAMDGVGDFLLNFRNFRWLLWLNLIL